MIVWKYPSAKRVLNFLTVDPLGCYCTECKVYVSLDTDVCVQRHLKNKHGTVLKAYLAATNMKYLKGVRDDLVFWAKYIREQCNDHSGYIESTRIYEKYWCDNCFTAFDGPSKYQNHIQSKPECRVDDASKVGCYQLHSKKFCKASELKVGVRVNPQPTPDSNTIDEDAIIPLSENEELLMDIDDFFTVGNVVCRKYNPKQYQGILQGLIEDLGVDFRDKLVQSVQAMDTKRVNESLESDSGLGLLQKRFDQLLTDFPRLMLRVKEDLIETLVFFGNGAKWDIGFNVREQDQHALLKETFHRILLFLNERKCDVLAKYVQMAREDKHDPNYYTVILFIKELYVENVRKPQFCSWIMCFLYSRCFQTSGESLCVRSPNECSSLASDVLYILRLGQIAFVASHNENGDGLKESMIKAKESFSNGKICKAIYDFRMIDKKCRTKIPRTQY